VEIYYSYYYSVRTILWLIILLLFVLLWQCYRTLYSMPMRFCFVITVCKCLFLWTYHVSCCDVVSVVAGMLLIIVSIGLSASAGIWLLILLPVAVFLFTSLAWHFMRVLPRVPMVIGDSAVVIMCGTNVNDDRRGIVWNPNSSVDRRCSCSRSFSFDIPLPLWLLIVWESKSLRFMQFVLSSSASVRIST